MQLLVTRMLTTLSLLTLLILAAVGLRLHGWSTEKTLVQWFATPELFNVAELAPAQDVVAPNLETEFVAYTLPELTLEAPIRKIAAVRKSLSIPRVEFQRVQKEIHILDEVFAPIEEFEPTGGEWRELQGSTTVPEFDSIKLEAVASAPIEATNLLALADQYSLPQETMLAEVKDEKKEAAPAQVVEDAVKTAQAAPAVDAEPEFFTYEDEPAKKVKATPVVAEQVAEYSLPEDISVAKAPETTTQKDIRQTEDEELITYTYTGAQPTKHLARPAPTVAHASKLKPGVDTHKVAPGPAPKPEPEPELGFMNTQASVVIAPLSVGTQVTSLRNFEMRAQDLSLIHISEPTRPY